MIDIINKSWDWTGVKASEIVQINDFGNIIFKSENEEYWRICPEEASYELIANNEDEFNELKKDYSFISDWKMKDLVNIAKSKFGELKEGDKFCLKLPAIIGGEYSEPNLGTINFEELIKFSGVLGYQLKDARDGDQFNIRMEN